jgi:peptide/nickel transport system substrate-binding protein
VPEAEVSASDIGLRQAAAFLTAEGLTAQSNDGRVRPSLAESWKSSEDGLVWRFSLRDGVTFHDGTAATASALVESIRAAVAERPLRGARPGLTDIVRVDADGDRTIVITLRRRSTFLLEDLDIAINRVMSDKSIVGTGPFKTMSASPAEITLAAHGAYHGGRPQLDRVVVRAYPTLRTAWAALMRQEIDVLYDLSRDAVEFAKSSEVALHSYLRHYVYAVAFNSARPMFAAIPVRRALNAAIDRDALIREVLRGQGLPSSGPLWPQHWAYDSTVPGYVSDPSLAGTTLDAAGFKLITRAGGRRSRLTFTCILPQNWVIWERMALNVQKQLYDVGVDMQLEMLPAEEFNRRVRAGDFDAVMIEMRSGPFLSRPYAYWRWGGERTDYNVFGYRSAAADRWFDAIRSAPAEAEYRVAAGQLQRALLEDPPALFLAWTQRTRAVSRRFNVHVDVNRDPMPSILRWTVNDGSTVTH